MLCKFCYFKLLPVQKQLFLHVDDDDMGQPFYKMVVSEFPTVFIPCDPSTYKNNKKLWGTPLEEI